LIFSFLVHEILSILPDVMSMSMLTVSGPATTIGMRTTTKLRHYFDIASTDDGMLWGWTPGHDADVQHAIRTDRARRFGIVTHSLGQRWLERC